MIKFTALQRWVLILSFCPAYLAAQEFPTLSPKLQPLMDSAAAQFNLARPNVEKWFTWPTGAGVPVPCESALLDLHRLAGARPLDVDDPEAKRNTDRTMRKLGLLADAIKTEYKVSRLHIVKAQCLNGRLEGDVEAWLDYEQINDSQDFTSIAPWRVHFKAQLQASRPLLENKKLISRWLFQDKTIHKDPATAKMMSESGARRPVMQSALFSSSDGLGSVAVSYMSMDGKIDLTTVVIDVESLSPKPRVTMRNFSGSQLTGESKMRDGLMHGWSIVYPHTSKMLGIAVPGSKTCFEEGELIKSNTCDVD